MTKNNMLSPVLFKDAYYEVISCKVCFQGAWNPMRKQEMKTDRYNTIQKKQYRIPEKCILQKCIVEKVCV